MKSLLSLLIIFGTVATAFAISAAPHSLVRNEDVWLTQPARRLTHFGDVVEASLSPDQKSIAFLRRDKKSDGQPDLNSLWLVAATPVATARQVFSWRRSPDSLIGMGDLHWSFDGTFLYLLAGPPAASFKIYRINVQTGEENAVVDGASLKVIQDGPYKGMLLVARHTCYKERLGCDYPTSIVRPDGSTLLVVPDSGGASGHAVVNDWLRTHHWKAS